MTKLKLKFEVDLGREHREDTRIVEMEDGWTWDEVDDLYDAWRDDQVEQYWQVLASDDGPGRDVPK